MVAFIALVALVDLWALRNFGRGLDKLSSLLLASTGFGVAWKFLGHVAGKGVTKALADKLIGRAVLWLFSTQFLALGWALTLLVALTVSPVEIVNDVPKVSVPVSVAPVDRPDEGSEKVLSTTAEVVRFRVFTGPFGRSFRIRARGYVDQSFAVFPLKGRRLQLGEDLVPYPTLLFRPPADVLALLKKPGRFQLHRVDVSQSDSVRTIGLGQHSVRVGGEREIPSDVVSNWLLLLQAEGMEPAEVSRIRLYWQNPVTFEGDIEVRPGTRWVGEIYSSTDTLLARADVTVGRGPFIDVAMNVPTQATR